MSHRGRLSFVFSSSLSWTSGSPSPGTAPAGRPRGMPSCRSQPRRRCSGASLGLLRHLPLALLGNDLESNLQVARGGRLSAPKPSAALLYTDFTRVGHGGLIFFA